MCSMRLFSPGWMAVVSLAFVASYLFLPRLTSLTQLEREDDATDSGEDVFLRGEWEAGQDNETSYVPSPQPSHRDRFRFIYSRKRLKLIGPKVNSVSDDVRWHHDPADTCARAGSPLVLAVVMSAITEAQRRDFIRDTWGRPSWYPETRLSVVFMLGATPDAALQSAVDAEAEKHGDIAQYNYIDSYANLTYKTISMLTWAVSRCPDALFVAKIDDDVLVNPFHLHDFLQRKLESPPSPQGVLPGDNPYRPPPSTNPATTYIYGRYDAKPKPLRITKWALSFEEYPENVFPPFVHGPAYLLGRYAAREIVRVAPYVPLIKLEDVYITGLVAHAAGLRHVQIYKEVSTFKADAELYRGTQAILEETVAKEREEAWQHILKYAPKV